MASDGESPQARADVGRGANLEIKARCGDLEAARDAARGLGARCIGLDLQRDTYFATRRGRLKLRESSLSGGQLIPYLRPDRAAPRRSDYRVLPVSDPASLRALLVDILGVRRVVVKRREIHLYANVRIHLDRVDGLGDFVELEAVFDGSSEGEAAQRATLDRLMRELRIAPADLLAGSYEGLVGG